MYKNFFKRFFDILVSVIALPFFCLIFIIVAPLIFFTDKGPVFYNAPRLGKNGKIFKMYKFRSMYVNAPDIRLPDGSTYNSEDDYRVTKIGKILRKASIDEIPQILNVLLGQMSLVGPRPNLAPDNFDDLSEIEKKRVEVRPGITGYNQAFFRNDVTTEEKFMNDVFYIENLSFGMDVKVIVKTFFAVLKRENIYASTQKDVSLQDKREMAENLKGGE